MLEKKYGEVWYTGTLVLLIGDENTYFYDEQIVEVPKNKIVIAGIYVLKIQIKIQVIKRLILPWRLLKFAF